ncbi:MAG: hypothetical protein QOJ20_3542, partial [Mycobacterium sp.]|nr:hypothetical protein [Mycobacterium sp.]
TLFPTFMISPISRRLVGTSVTADASLGAKRDVLHASPEALSLGTKGAACYLEPHFWFAQSGRDAAVTGMETDQ